MEDRSLVTVASFGNPFEAELAKSLLEDYGFEVELQNERIMSIYPSIAGDMYMIQLQVPEDREQEARKILTDLEDTDYVSRILSSENALLEGHFSLTSGKHSNRYIEKIKVLQNPHATHDLCKRLAARLEDYDFDCIVGPAYGAIVLAFETAYLMEKAFIFTQRKEEKMVIRGGFDLSEVKKVAIIEDILTTGGSINEVVQCLSEAGIETAVIGVLVDRSGGKIQLPAPLESLLSLEVPAWDAEECPLCKEGVPLSKPGSSDKKP